MPDVQIKNLRFGHDPGAPGGGVNVRTTERDAGLEALAASIEAHDLIQPLVAVAGAKGVWFVVDGNRRLAALQSLVKAKRLKANDVVPVTIAPDEVSAREIGLAANIMRLPLHEADQYEAFVTLADGGMEPPAIAARFGVEPLRVRRMLAIGRLSPKVRAAWREGRLDGRDAVDVVRAFTLAPSIEEQDRVLDELSSKGWLYAHHVREAFGAGRGEAGKLLTFVGKAAYEAAGGSVIEDLFGTSHVVSDPALAKRLADEKLLAECERLVAEGWSWASPSDALPPEASYMWRPIEQTFTLTASEEARILAQREIIEELEQREELSDEESDEVDAAEAEIGRIEAEAAARGFSEADKARSGCIVRISHDGRLDVRQGIMKPDAASRKNDQGTSTADAAGSSEPKADKASAVSANLMHRLSIQMTLAVQDALPASPHAALAALVAAATGTSWDAPVKVSVQGYGWSHPAATDTFADRFARLLAMSPTELSAAAAHVAAKAVDLQSQNVAAPPAGSSSVSAIAAAMDARELGAALRRRFNAEDYFASAPKALVLRSIEEAINPDEARKAGGMKKVELAAFALANVAPTGWLPPEIRPAGYPVFGLRQPVEDPVEQLQAAE